MRKLRDPKEVFVKGKSVYDIIISYVIGRDDKRVVYDLKGSDLSYIDFRSIIVIMTRYDLQGCNFEGSEFGDLSLGYSNLQRANFRNCIISHMYCVRSNLNLCNFAGVKSLSITMDSYSVNGIVNFPMACPRKGSFIGYKIALLNLDKSPRDQCVVELEIPEDAKRSSATSNKCRCSKAIVKAIYDLYHNKLDDNTIAYSYWNNLFEYKVGETVYPDKFDINRWYECSDGIHFFMTFDEAVAYYI